ncbi:hypothetical protein Dcar01_02380 [Deinococcus carri]|uniref:Uncharacterized protein n=1 Tax=Deinococcus carri TaxID=1211323 RepID=A0ABP9W9E5_9DEIO
MPKNRALLTLTALLLANAPFPRGEGEGTTTTTTGNDGRLTAEEWQARNDALHAKTSHSDLIKRVTTLERENETLKGNQVPNGARVLRGQELKDYEAYLALGKPDELGQKLKEHGEYAALGKPGDVKKKVEDGDKAASTLADRDRTDAIRTAAEHAGFKQTVLGDRLKADGLTVLPSKEVERDGKKVQVAYVKDGQGVEHELGEYAKKNWTDYLPALQVQASGDGSGSGTEFTRQDSTATTTNQNGGGGGSWVKQTLAKQSEGGGYKDPLQPQAAAAK